VTGHFAPFRHVLGLRKPRVSREAAADWRATLRRRVAIATGVLAVWSVCIEAKLIYLQVFQRADLETRAKEQHERIRPVSAKRGNILDRHGKVLATSVEAESTIFVVPAEIPDKPAAVARLCAALADCTSNDRQTLLKRFNNPKSAAYARVARQVTPEQAARVDALGLSFVGFEKETRRYYPNEELAAHVLGWVGSENDGQGGIERAYNNQIRGTEGQAVILNDAKGRIFNRLERSPTPGATLELTIDQNLQHVTERELHAGVIENRAVAGAAIVMNPRTGEILALASEPTFDPNEPPGLGWENRRRNRAVQDVYEPGSTFKLITAAAAIENRLMPLDTLIDTSPGHIRIGNRIFRDTSNHGTISFVDVIADSSNVGAIKIGARLGVERLSQYVHRFGFGQPSSSDFRAESRGILSPAEQWSDLTLASISIGYGVAVTPMQLLAAVSSIANGGGYFEPRVVSAKYENDRRHVVRPTLVRRSITAETAATLTGIMEKVVEEGTGTAAKIPGYTVAGKTGTAQKVVNGVYSSDYYASFVGFVPSRDPEIAIIVVIDSPRAKGYYGGAVSAPIFRRIAESALRHLGIAPTINPNPPLLVARLGAGPWKAAAAVDETPAITLVANVPPGTVPDLRGLSAREALQVLVKLGLKAPHISGDGLVVSQKPAPGSALVPGSDTRLVLSRLASVRSSTTAAQP